MEQMTEQEEQMLTNAIRQIRASILARTAEGSQERSDALYSLQDVASALAHPDEA